MWPVRSPRVRPWMLVSAAWTVPALLGAVNQIAQRRLAGEPPPPTPELLFASGDWLLYALLTPAVFAIARRWPISRPRPARAALIHLGMSLAFCAAWAAAGTVLRAGADTLRALLPGWQVSSSAGCSSRFHSASPSICASSASSTQSATSPRHASATCRWRGSPSSCRPRDSPRCRRSSIHTSCSTRSTRSPCWCETRQPHRRRSHRRAAERRAAADADAASLERGDARRGAGAGAAISGHRAGAVLRSPAPDVRGRPASAVGGGAELRAAAPRGERHPPRHRAALRRRIARRVRARRDRRRARAVGRRRRPGDRAAMRRHSPDTAWPTHASDCARCTATARRSTSTRAAGGGTVATLRMPYRVLDLGAGR